MLNLFVLDVLNAFTPEEKVEFRMYMQSHFFNKGANRDPLIELLEILWEAQASGRIDGLEKDTIFQALFPNKVLVESKVDKLISELKKHTQNFLTVQRYLSPKNETRKALDFTAALRERGLYSRYRQTLDKIQKEDEQQPLETIDHYFLRHLIALEEHEWESTFNKAKGNLHIPEVIMHLDNYYWTLRSEMLNRLLLQQKLTVLSPQASQLLEEDIEFPSKVLNSNAMLGVIRDIHLSMKTAVPDPQSFFLLMERLQLNEAKFSAKSMAEFYTYLRNLCSIFIDAGRLDFLPILHDIQRDNLQRGYFYFEGKITPNALLSITLTALNVGAIAWANNFVASHQGLIMDDNDTQDLYRLNKAICLFSEKKHEAALETIPLGSSYSFYHLLARRLELKIYYELDSDLLSYKIDAFKMFISRAGNKVLSPRMRDLNVNFINFLRQFSFSSKIHDRSRAEKMVERIHQKKLVAERNWLLEKARELDPSKK